MSGKIVGGWGVDPAVALRLINAADYRLPTFGPHGIKLGSSWYQWIIKSDFSGWFDNSKKGRLSGLGVDPVVALPLRNAADYRLPTFGPHGTKLGPSWYQWIIKVIFLAGLTILKKVRCLGRLSGLGVDPVKLILLLLVSTDTWQTTKYVWVQRLREGLQNGGHRDPLVR